MMLMLQAAPFTWNGEFSRESVLILAQHAVQGKLTGADTALARALEREAGEDARGKTQAEEWFEVMLQDVAGRLGAVRRSRQRIQRAFKEDAARSGAMDKEAVSAEFTRESAACVLAACSATMLRELDSGLEKEGEALEQWLQQLDALRQMQNTIEIAAAAQAAQAAST